MESQKSLELNANEVHIWSASLLEGKNNKHYFYSILSKDERERASSFRFSRDHKRFTITRGILRCLLSNYLGQTPESIEIIYGLWGKPSLSEEKFLHFNVSHSGDYALFAVTRSYEVGIDLEYIDKSLELEDMAFCIFSPSELTYWMNLDLEDRVNSFFKRWTCKEAFLKASGNGWLGGEKETSFNIKGEFRKSLSNDELTYPYYFECIPGYVGALCVEGPPLQRLYYNWN